VTDIDAALNALYEAEDGKLLALLREAVPKVEGQIQEALVYDTTSIITMYHMDLGDPQCRSFSIAYRYAMTVVSGLVEYHPALQTILYEVCKFLIQSGCPPGNTLVDNTDQVHLWFSSADTADEWLLLSSIVDEFLLTGFADEDEGSAVLGSVVVNQPFWPLLYLPAGDRRIGEWSANYAELLLLFLEDAFAGDVRLHLDGYISYGRKDGEEEETRGDTGSPEGAPGLEVADSGVPEERQQAEES